MLYDMNHFLKSIEISIIGKIFMLVYNVKAVVIIMLSYLINVSKSKNTYQV